MKVKNQVFATDVRRQEEGVRLKEEKSCEFWGQKPARLKMERTWKAKRGIK